MGNHEEVTTPGWDTKVACSCGERCASRAQLWKHQADALRRETERLREVANAAVEWRDSDSDETYWALCHAVDDYLVAVSQESQP